MITREEPVQRTGINGIEEVGALLGLLDVCIDEERVGFRVNVLNHDLESIEAASFGDLHLIAEALQQVLVDNAVGRGKESQDVRDKVALIIVQAAVPIVQILGEIDFLGGPERGLSLLVHLPDLIFRRLNALADAR